MKLTELIQKLVETKTQYEHGLEMAEQLAANDEGEKASIKRLHAAANLDLVLELIGELAKRYPASVISAVEAERERTTERIERLAAHVELLAEKVMAAKAEPEREKLFHELGDAHTALMVERIRAEGEK